MRRSFSDARTVGMTAAIVTVILGLVYLTLAGAPARMVLINAAALGMGLVLLVLAKLLARAAALRGPLLVASSLLLLGTAFGGVASEGASRWLSIGGLVVQPGLMLAPILVTAFAVRADRWSVAALAIALLAIALQPDRGVAAMLLAGVAVVAMRKPEPKQLVVGSAALAGFVVTLLQPDTLGAVPFVDRILYTSFAVSPVAGVAVWAGVILMIIPALSMRQMRSAAPAEAFAAVWAAAILAAAVGNYPTPLVGYGASAIIGYLLALAPLTMSDRSVPNAGPAPATDIEESGNGSRLRFT